MASGGAVGNAPRTPPRMRSLLIDSFGGTPKARQPLMFCLSLCLSLCLSRSHVHTSGTKPAVCLLGFYVVSCNS